METGRNLILGEGQTSEVALMFEWPLHYLITLRFIEAVNYTL